MDMIKVRIQLGSEAGGSTNPFVVAKEIKAAAGFKGFYAGLDSALLR
jgi:solute carrier family 25 oxoglutarate transporter 11